MAKVSISIDDTDLKWLKRRARRLHNGNLSAAIAEGTRLIRKNEGLHALLDKWGVPELTPAEREAIDAELGWGPPRPQAHSRTQPQPKQKVKQKQKQTGKGRKRAA